MPETDIVFFMDSKGETPALEWILSCSDKVQDKAEARIMMLENFGYELRRPVIDHLRDGIYELRWNEQRVNYRLLYAFAGRNRAVLLHGLTKEKKVPQEAIDLAVSRLREFIADPIKHTYSE